MSTRTAEIENGRGSARVFSGHESFALRYGWLPKLYEAVTRDPEVFGDDEGAILALGLGRNMVKSIRFWGEAFGVTGPAGRLVRPTEFGRRLIDPDLGIDPFLEDAGSLWRLHWNLTVHGGLGAWTTAFLNTPDAEVSRARLVELVAASAGWGRRPITSATASAHVDMLIKTYDASADATAAAPEDALGSPLQELDMLKTVHPGGVETVRLNRGAKPGLDARALAYAISDHWAYVAAGSSALSLRSILLDRVSPGVVFRLDEATMHDLLEDICIRSDALSLRGDGVGGVELVCRRGSADAALERVAW